MNLAKFDLKLADATKFHTIHDLSSDLIQGHQKPGPGHQGRIGAIIITGQSPCEPRGPRGGRSWDQAAAAEGTPSNQTSSDGDDDDNHDGDDRGTPPTKKSFRHCPNYPRTTSHKSGKLYNFFGHQKQRFSTFDDFGVRNDQKVYT